MHDRHHVPATLFSPDRHHDFWSVQEGLHFPGTVYGATRDTPIRTIMNRQAEFYGAHINDHRSTRSEPNGIVQKAQQRSQPGEDEENCPAVGSQVGIRCEPGTGTVYELCCGRIRAAHRL
jgi:hypothetical protein